MEERTSLDEQPTPPREEASEPPQSPARRRGNLVFKIIGGIFLTLIVCFFLLCVFSVWYVNRWPKPDGALDTWDFGKNGAQGVTVPFTSLDGLIHIQGFIGKRRVLFTVDTGSSHSILPKRLNLGTQYADDAAMVDAAGNIAWTRPVFLPDVRIGNAAIRDFSAMVPEYDLQHKPITSGSTVTNLTFGNSALSRVVVTIDYSKDLITFQPPQQQALPPLANPSISTRFTWPKGDTALHNGAPFISGDTNHHPLSVVLDTGTAATIVIPASLKDILIKSKTISLTGRKAKTNMLFGLGPEVETTPLTVSLHTNTSLQGRSIIANAQVVTGWSDPTCVLIGEDAMVTQIMTIDYPHRTVTFADDPRTAEVILRAVQHSLAVQSHSRKVSVSPKP